MVINLASILWSATLTKQRHTDVSEDHNVIKVELCSHIAKIYLRF